MPSSIPSAPRLIRPQAAPARGARKPNADLIYRELFDGIIDHRVPPGTALPEDTLAGAFGVSRTVVRKSLLRLAHEKLIELRPNRGAVVARPSVEEAREVFEARRMIEAAVVDAVVERAGRGDFSALRAQLAEEQAAEARADRRAHIRLSGEFHRRLAEIAGNTVLTEFVGELVSRTSLILALYEPPGRSPCSYDQHAGVLEAIATRDSAAAKARMIEHLVHCERQLELGRFDQPVDLQALFAHVRLGRDRRRAS